jgi:arylsulfatase
MIRLFSLRVLWAVLGIQVVAVAMPAQQPSFAGRWAVVPDSTPSGRGAGPATGSPGSGWGTPLTITQDAARLIVEQPFFSRYDMQPPLKFTYALDGSETRNAVNLGEGEQVQRSRAQWNGATLVITTIHVFPNPSGAGDSLRVEVTQRLSLETPTRLIAETTRAGVLGGSSSVTRTVYTKQ